MKHTHSSVVSSHVCVCDEQKLWSFTETQTAPPALTTPPHPPLGRYLNILAKLHFFILSAANWQEINESLPPSSSSSSQIQSDDQWHFHNDRKPLFLTSITRLPRRRQSDALIGPVPCSRELLCLFWPRSFLLLFLSSSCFCLTLSWTCFTLIDFLCLSWLTHTN